ncbi:MAG: kynureninase, partial [Acidimicrobiales bacterium]
MTPGDLDAGEECARALDAADPLAAMRQRFHVPIGSGGREVIYLVGNSLGLAPRRAARYVADELDRWARLGVSGHFEGEHPWMPYHEELTAPMARVVGARPEEVVVMNSLTVNLHLMMAGFYRPTGDRHRVLIEEHAFPSDHFAVASQIRHHGLDPSECLVTVAPRVGEETLRTADVVDAIRDQGSSLALVLLPGVQYYTGQALAMADVTTAGHEVGAMVGFDLAHAVGNLELDLHDWGPDFAVWCNYKYLNGGPGAVGGCFVHERHLGRADVPRLEGWWGTAKDTRFEMLTEFDPIPTVEAWQLSNPPILAMAALRASLEIFDEVGGMAAVRAKALDQVTYLDYLLDELFADEVECITPRAPDARGGQLSLRLRNPIDGRAVFRALEADDVACDWRHPDVIRI